MLKSAAFPDRTEFRMGKRGADPRDWKVRCVCSETCNNGWMRELEDAAEPTLRRLFSGQTCRLSPTQQEIVATWASVKAIAAEYEDPGHATVHHAQRRYIYRHRRPPKNGWAIWIGHYPRDPWVPIYRNAPFQYVPSTILAKRSSPRAAYYNGSITTQFIGELFIQVIHAPKEFGLADLPYPIFPDGGILRRIWPPATYSLVWPIAPLSHRDAEIATELHPTRMVRHLMKKYRPVTHRPL